MVVMLMHGQTNSQNKPERASYCFFISWTSRLSSIKVFDNVADCPRARKFSAPDKCARGQQFGCYPIKEQTKRHIPLKGHIGRQSQLLGVDAKVFCISRIAVVRFSGRGTRKQNSFQSQ